MVEQVTRIRFVDGDERDRYGKPIRTEDRTTHTAHGFAPQVTAEADGVEQTLNTDRGTLYFRAPHFTDALPEDQFIIRGTTYKAIGADADWWHPTGERKGTAVVVERVAYTDG